MSLEIDVEAPTAIEHGLPSAEIPQFSANLFAGPCFGDLSPSESSPTTLPDAPSPSPLLLNSFPDSNYQAPTIQSAPAPGTGDLINFNTAEDNRSDMFSSPSELENQLHDPSTATSLMDPSPIYYQEASQSLATSTLSSMSGANSHIPMLHLDDSSGVSSALISVDEQFFPQPPGAKEPLEPSNTNDPPNTDENVFPDLTNDEFPILDQSPLSESTETLTQTMPIDVALDENVVTLVLPSSSPIDGPTSSPTFTLTPPTYSSSEAPSDVVDPSTYSSPFPLTFEHSNSDLNSYPLAITPYEPETNDFATSLPASTSYSSPPSSSPELIFSSSPPAASDSSVPEDFAVPKSANTHMSVDSADLSPSSSPPLHSTTQMHDPDSLKQDGPPPSSSPMPPSSSPMHPFMELTEPPRQLKMDEVDAAAFNSNTALSSSNSVQHPGSNPTAKPEQKENCSADVSPSSLTSIPLNVRSAPKRKREEEKEERTREETGEEITTQPPNPKRPTLASQKLQRKTLAKPFRSPAMIPPKATELTPPPSPLKKEGASIEQPTKDDLKKHRTQRAAGQFKSPLPLAASSSIPSAVRPTPTIQALERKVQVLRRAAKVKKGGEEQTLEALVKKWTEAGREVAWEVWALVKDNDSGGGDDWGKASQSATSGKRRIQDSWGWNEDSGSKRVKVEDEGRNWGWDVSPATGTDDHSTEQPVQSVDEEKPRETLGTMLMRLGIAPTTLGWNDEEEEFVDE